MPSTPELEELNAVAVDEIPAKPILAFLRSLHLQLRCTSLITSHMCDIARQLFLDSRAVEPPCWHSVACSTILNQPHNSISHSWYSLDELEALKKGASTPSSQLQFLRTSTALDVLETMYLSPTCGVSMDLCDDETYDGYFELQLEIVQHAFSDFSTYNSGRPAAAASTVRLTCPGFQAKDRQSMPVQLEARGLFPTSLEAKRRRKCF